MHYIVMHALRKRNTLDGTATISDLYTYRAAYKEVDMAFSEFVGLTQDVASLIEARRLDADETKNDILRRILDASESNTKVAGQRHLDLGQGVQVVVGETLLLFLTQPKHSGSQPDGMAEVRDDGLYIDGAKVVASRGSMLAPAMHIFQKRLNHVNDKGELISLSAYRQWHVRRGNQLVPLLNLKDPRQKRTRTTRISGLDLSKIEFEL